MKEMALFMLCLGSLLLVSLVVGYAGKASGKELSPLQLPPLNYVPDIANTTAEYIRNYDGDTITVYIEAWGHWGKSVNIRVFGIDTPEIKGSTEAEKKKAKQARDYVRKKLKGRKIYLRDISTSEDKYGRVIARVFYREYHGKYKEIAQDLLNMGLAKPYNGGKK